MKIHSQETADGYIVHRENDSFLCEQIRGAYIEPNVPLSLPGYYIFVGKGLEKIGNEHPLFFLCEGTSVNRFELFEKVVDDAKRLLAHIIYSTKSLEELWEVLRGTEYRSFIKQLKALGINLGVSPSDDPISEGTQIVQRLHQYNLINIPKRSILYDQMITLRPDELDETCYAFNALSIVIIGFDRNPEIPLLGFKKCRDEGSEIRKGLTGISKAAWNELDYLRQMIRQQEEYERDLSDWHKDIS